MTILAGVSTAYRNAIAKNCYKTVMFKGQFVCYNGAICNKNHTRYQPVDANCFGVSNEDALPF
jgi:hypothetical protein